MKRCFSELVVAMVLAGAALAAEGTVQSGSVSNAPSADAGYVRAMELLHDGVVFEAMHTLEDFLRSHPDHEKAHMQMALLLQQTGRNRRAAAEAAAVLRINPDNPDARRLLTSIRIKLGRELDRKNADAVLDYARLCARPETYDRAADYYTLYFTLKSDPGVRLEFGKMLYWAGRNSDAEQQLLVYLKYNPRDREAHRLLGKIYDAQGRFDDAVAQYREALGKGNDIDLQLVIARSLLWGGRTDEAEKILDSIRARSAEYDEPMLLLAKIARARGRVQEEYKLYKEVLKVNPENQEALQRVAELEKGSLLQESGYLSRLKTDPEDTDTRRKLVALYLSEQRYGEAIAHLEELSKLLPQDRELAVELRRAREEEGRRLMDELHRLHRFMAQNDAAEIEQSRRWLQKNPNDYLARVRLVDLYIKNGRGPEALEELQVLNSMTPGDPRIAEKIRQAAVLGAESAENKQDKQL